ncbi:zinc finger protein 234-like [Bactrocera neohumeralis]|uniref:zinc finger protein 234-like n=1 Tax=Bactrocera neohumeralis TaxID=98809 RepID=UPI00216657CE|nr:zinc finger protein 234-like [Bactrocera neohumeralis]
MLKLLPSTTFDKTENAKCGEIFCHSSTEFIIICTLCELKAFDYQDFLLHCKNEHLEKGLLKTEEIFVEVAPHLASNVKDEPIFEDTTAEAEFLDEHDFIISDEEKEKSDLRISQWSDNKSLSDDSDSDTENNFDDKDYIPPVHQRKRNKKREDQTESFKCEICSRIYKSSNYLRSHLAKIHNFESKKIATIQLQKCDECIEEFKTLRSLEEHCLSEHGGMKCMYCDKRCTSRTNQLRHMETHTHGTERRFVCDYENCKKSFFTRRQYQAHKRTHTKGKNFICDICGYSCRVPEMLKVHYRSHTGEKPYACDECGKCFVSKSAVREHKASHGTERPHECKVCGRSFARAKSLYHHNFLHLAEKKFKCKLCGQAYAQLAGLAGHMRRHREQGHC